MLERVLIPEPGANERLDLATAWGDLGLVYCDLRDFVQAKMYLTRCWEEKKKQNEDLEVVIHNLEEVHQRLGQNFNPKEWQQSP